MTAKFTDDGRLDETTIRPRGWLFGELVASQVWNWETSAIISGKTKDVRE